MLPIFRKPGLSTKYGGNMSFTKKWVTAFVKCLCSLDVEESFLVLLNHWTSVCWSFWLPWPFDIDGLALEEHLTKAYSSQWYFFKWLNRLLVFPHFTVISLEQILHLGESKLVGFPDVLSGTNLKYRHTSDVVFFFDLTLHVYCWH